MPSNSIYKLPYGLEIIEGLMGAGKSFYAIKRLDEVLQETRRPVYTNLPIRWPVMRKYLRLRGGEQLAGLIHQLKEDHWRRFLKRQHELAKFREYYTGIKPAALDPQELQQLAQATSRDPQWLHDQPTIRDSWLFEWFRLHHGPEVYEGHQADSIYPGSLIVIDEVQHWHPMLRQGSDPAREQLQAYLTMCRHHMHWIWVITQDRTRIDIIFRNLASSVWRVWDRGEDRLAWSIRMKHFGLRAMGYQRYTREQLEGRNPEDVDPSESFTVLPQLPSNRVYFRLYSSVTNIGSKRDIERAISKARNAAGIDEQGITKQEHEHRQQLEMNKSTKKPLHRRLIRTATRATLIMVLLLISFAVGQSTAPQPTLTETTPNAPTQEVKPHNWPRFTGITSTTPLFDAQRITIGQTVGDRATLRYYDPRNRAAVLVADGGYWLWRYGDQIPTLVGPVDGIRAAYDRMVQAQANTPAITDEATDPG